MRENFRQPRRASCRRVGAQKCPMWGQGIGARVVPRIVTRHAGRRAPTTPPHTAMPSTTKRSLVAVGRGANPAKAKQASHTRVRHPRCLTCATGPRASAVKRGMYEGQSRV